MVFSSRLGRLQECCSVIEVGSLLQYVAIITAITHGNTHGIIMYEQLFLSCFIPVE